jgi:hypothetical protein
MLRPIILRPPLNAFKVGVQLSFAPVPSSFKYRLSNTLVEQMILLTKKSASYGIVKGNSRKWLKAWWLIHPFQLDIVG